MMCPDEKTVQNNLQLKSLMLTELESSQEAKAISGFESISNQPLHQTRGTSSAAAIEKKEKDEAEIQSE